MMFMVSKKSRHARESGHPGLRALPSDSWIPAVAGMTVKKKAADA